MTELIEDTHALDSDELDWGRQAINRAAANHRAYLFTPSALDRAATALAAVRQVMAEQGIAQCPPFNAYSHGFASQILHACEMRLTTDWEDLEEDIDPVALLDVAVKAAAEQLGRPLEPLQGPALAPEGRALFGYVMLAPQPESPGWGPEEDTPLVLSLGRPDLHALQVAYSSGCGWDGPYDPGPWCWYLGHRVPLDVCILETRVIAPAPSKGVAAEVGALTAQVLTGELPLPR